MEELMMQALDGTINNTDRTRLNAYFDAHADQREMFESMLQTEMMLRNLPLVSLPANFASNVMTAVNNARIAAKPSPVLNGNQVLVLFLTCTISAVMLLVIFAAILSVLTTYAGPQIQSTLIFLRHLTQLGRESLSVIAAFARFAISQPVVWIVSTAGGLVVAIWLRVLAGLWLPPRNQPQLA